MVPTDPAAPAAPGDPKPPSAPKLTGCGIDSGFPGDEYCILPPPPGLGFQIHTGPSSYDDPDEVAKYVVDAGQETVEFISATAGNEEDVYFYGRQYRMRPGSHHLIVSEAGGGGGSVLGPGRRLGGSQNPAKDNPASGTPPESVGIGVPLAAHAPLSLNLHYFNASDHPVLKETWVNIWYVDPATVTKEAKEMFLWAQGAAVQPGATATVTNSREITEAGRVLTMYGHRHSNNVRFSAHLTHEGTRELVYDDYSWEEPAVLEFNSLTLNATPNPDAHRTGGHTGILELLPGDTLDWQCDVQNNREVPITFGENEAATSEMCILVGDALGPALLGF